MQRFVSLVFILAVLLGPFFLACDRSELTGDVSCDAGTSETSIPIDAMADAPDVRDAPCSIRADRLAPARVSRDGGTLVTVDGCGFLGTADVQVRVQSTSFVVLDDRRLVFIVPAIDIPETEAEYPLLVQVDIIRRPADQTQIDLIYEW